MIGPDPLLDANRYCEQIERYLCRKNDGHLIRVVGPSFEIVSRWAAEGIPVKVACRGIDRHFERYYAKARRRRPVKIDFCDADVRDVFDEWRRAVGLPADRGAETGEATLPAVERHSLPAHLERAVMRLSGARASGALSAAFDPLIDAVAAALDDVRAHAGGIRGAARDAMVARLAALDRELDAAAVSELAPATLDELRSEAVEDLRSFRTTMPPDSFARAVAAAVARQARERLGVPTVAHL